MTLLRYFDLLVLVLALPIFIVADLPLAGYLVAAAAWLVQRGVQVLFERRAAASRDPRTVVGLSAASMILRGWLAAGAIFAVGLNDSKAGLAASIMFILLFTIYFPMRMISRPIGKQTLQP